MQQKLCELPGCNSIVKNWRHRCCNRSHASKLSAYIRHGTVPIIYETIDERKTRTLAYIQQYVLNKQKRTAQATPKWANRKLIKNIYDECRRITKETGIIHEVDHIIPLTSKLVCGLHVENNLQILTKEANRAKYNHTEF